MIENVSSVRRVVRGRWKREKNVPVRVEALGIELGPEDKTCASARWKEQVSHVSNGSAKLTDLVVTGKACQPTRMKGMEGSTTLTLIGKACQRTCIKGMEGCTTPRRHPRNPIIGFASCRPSKRAFTSSVAAPDACASCTAHHHCLHRNIRQDTAGFADSNCHNP